MESKRPKPDEIVSKLRQVELLMGQGMPRLGAIRRIGVVEQTFYRLRKQYDGMGVDQLKELKRLQKQNERLRRTISNLTLDKLILKEAPRRNYRVPLVAKLASIMCEAISKRLGAGPVACWDNIVRHRGEFREAVPMRIVWLPT